MSFGKKLTLSDIPLFPLGVILFPESQVPLHIFEERYKRLCAEAIAKNGVFGINFVEDSSMHSVGCAARISEVTKKYKDGELDIVTEGVRRYEIVKLEQSDPNDLSYATIKWIDDVPEIRDVELTEATITLFNDLCEVAYKGSVDPLDVMLWSAQDKQPSFAIAQKAGLSPEQRQSMLTIRSENERLTILKEHLQALLPRIEEAEKIQKLISNDGYLANWNKKE
jgi:ATP-dependent Lon protease